LPVAGRGDKERVVNDTEHWKDHPDDATTASYLEGRLSGRARERFQAHLASCDDCRAGVILLGGAQVAGPVADEEFPPEQYLRMAREPQAQRSPTTWRRRLIRAAALIAGVGLLSAAGLWLFGPERVSAPDEPVFRDGSESVFADLEPAPGESVDRLNLEFRWGPVSDAERYEIRVSDADGLPRATLHARAEKTRISWPLDLPPPEPGSLIWRIRAMRHGRVVAESPPIQFEVSE
jgi:hypothetical protein